MCETNFKWTDGFESGSFRDFKLYLVMNNYPPNRITYRLDKTILDLENVDVNSLRQHFPNAIISFSTVRDEKKRSSVDEIYNEDEEEETEIFIRGAWQGASLSIYNKDVFYIIESDVMQILFKDGKGEDYVKEILELLPTKNEVPKGSEIKLVAFSGDYYTIKSKIESTNINIVENYNDDFVPIYNDIVSFLNARKSGLIVLRGKMGTGKTSLIRNLITNVPKNYILVTTAIAAHLASPEFLSFMIDNKDSVFILEDCEQILMDRRENTFGGAIANILNMSDGLMSDIFNVKFICTFNADINCIDSALLRKGRCYANYEFKELSDEKTKVLLNRQGIKLDKYEPLTLAEIFNYENKDHTKNNISNKKMGF